MSNSLIYDFLMKTRKNGIDSMLYPVTRVNNVRTTSPINVTLSQPRGSFKSGDVIPAGSNMYDILTKILQEQVLPEYAQPNITFSVKNYQSTEYEIGSTINPEFFIQCDAGDSGGISNLQLVRDGVVISNNSQNELTYTDNITICNDEIIYTAKATYIDGVVKNDNFGNPYPNTAITAGTISKTISFLGYRAYFYTHDSIGSNSISSNEIRSYKYKSDCSAEIGTEFIIHANIGDRRVSFAYPSQIGSVTSVKYVEGGNDDYKSLFDKTTVDVEGMNEFASIGYNVYTLIFSQPIINNMTFIVTI